MTFSLLPSLPATHTRPVLPGSGPRTGLPGSDLPAAAPPAQERPAMTPSRPLPGPADAQPPRTSPTAIASAACAAAALIPLAVFFRLAIPTTGGPPWPPTPAWYLTPLLAAIITCITAVLLAATALRQIQNAARRGKGLAAAGIILAVIQLPLLGLLTLTTTMAITCHNSCF